MPQNNDTTTVVNEKALVLPTEQELTNLGVVNPTDELFYGYATPTIQADENQFGFQPKVGANNTELLGQDQSAWSAFKNSHIQLLSEIGLGALEGLGYLGDFEQHINMMRGKEEEFSNWFSDIMLQGKEGIRERFPVHATEASEGFKPWKGRWWATQYPQLGSTLALMIPVAGTLGAATKVAKWTNRLQKATTGIDALNKVSKTGSMVTRGLAGATMSRYMENTMEAHQTVESVYNQAIAAGKSEEEAKTIAGEAGREVWIKNSAMLLTDIPQYLLMTKGFNFARGGNKLAKSKLNTIAGVLTEGFEEGYQFTIGKEAERKALIKAGIVEDDKTSFGDRMKKYVADGEFQSAVFMGALGGGVFQFAGSKLERYLQKKQLGTYIKALEKEREEKLGNVDKVSKIENESFVKSVVDHARAGKLDDLDTQLTKLKEEINLKEDLTDEQRQASIEDIETKKKDLAFVEKEFNRLQNNKKLSEDLKLTELAVLTRIHFAERHLNNKNSELQNTLSEAKNTLQSEYAELYENKILGEAYKKLSPTLSKVFTDKYKQLVSELKKDKAANKEGKDYLLDLDTNIEEGLTTSLDGNIIDTIQEIESTKQELSELKKDLATIKKSPEVLEKAIQEQKQNAANREFKEKLDKAINPDDFSKLLEEYKEDKKKVSSITKKSNQLLKKQKQEAGPFDINKLQERYEGREILKANEFTRASNRYNKNIESIEDLKTTIEANQADFKKQQQEEADVENEVQSETIEIDESPEIKKYTKEDKDNEEVDELLALEFGEEKVEQALLPMMHHMVMEEKNNKFITVYDNTGNPIHSPKDNLNIDWHYINNGNLKKGDTIHFEVPLLFESGTFKNETANVDNKLILTVHYIDGNVNNKSEANRKVLGALKAVHDYKTYDKNIEALKRIRERIVGELNNSNEVDTFTSKLTTQVNEVFSGRFWSTDKLNNPKEILRKDIPLVFGVGVDQGEGVTRLVVPNAEQYNTDKYDFNNVFVRDANVSAGAIYQLIPAANNTIVPYRLLTNDVRSIPEIEAKVKKLLEETNINNWREKKDELKKYVWLEYGYNENGFIIPKVQGTWTPNVFYEKYSIGSKPVQVRVGKPEDSINIGDYNERISKEQRIFTDINPSSYMHSAKFSILPLSEEIESKEKVVENKTEVEGSIPEQKELPSEKPKRKFKGRVKGKGDKTIKLGKLKASLKDTNFYQKWNKKEELKWFNERLPNVSITVLEDLKEIHKKGGIEAWGLFHNAAVYIAENAKVGTTYHEAFHAVFHLFLNEEQQAKVLREAFNEFGESLNISKDEFEKALKNKEEVDFLLSINENAVEYTLKSVKSLQSDKAKQVFNKGKKNNWSLDKILTELQIPKAQKQIILDKYKDKVSEQEFIKSIFPDTKVKQIVYHGSPNTNITSFKSPEDEGYKKQETTTTGVAGIYVTDTKEIADRYQDFAKKGIKGKTYSLIVNVKRPLIVGEKATDGITKNTFGATSLWNIQKGVITGLRKAGIDGIMTGSYARKNNAMGENTEIAVFNSKQIHILTEEEQSKIYNEDNLREEIITSLLADNAFVRERDNVQYSENKSQEEIDLDNQIKNLRKEDGSIPQSKMSEFNQLSRWRRFIRMTNKSKIDSALQDLNQDNNLTPKESKILSIYIGFYNNFNEAIEAFNKKTGKNISTNEKTKWIDKNNIPVQDTLDNNQQAVNEKIDNKSKETAKKLSIEIDKEYSANELDDFVSKHGDKQTKFIWNLIKKVAELLGVKTKFLLNKDYKGPKESNGFFSGGQIVNRASTLQTPSIAARVIVHELVHGVTSYIITAVSSNNQTILSKLSQKQINAAKKLSNLLKQIKNDPNLKEQYGATDEHELLAELTNNEFVKGLKAKKLNFVEKVLDYILDILGVPTNAYKEALSILEDMISQPIDYISLGEVDNNKLYSVDYSLSIINALDKFINPPQGKRFRKYGERKGIARQTLRLNTKEKPYIETNIKKALQGKGVTNQQIDLLFDYMKQNNFKEISVEDAIKGLKEQYGFVVDINTAKTSVNKTKPSPVSQSEFYKTQGVLTQLEEKLAKKFEEYKLTQNDRTLVGEVKNFFKRLWQMIKSVVTSDVSVNELFYRIDEGFYRNRKVFTKNVNKFKEPKYSLADFDPLELQRRTKLINDIFFNEVLPTYKDLDENILKTNKQVIKEVGIESLYEDVYNILLNTLEEIPDNETERIDKLEKILDNLVELDEQGNAIGWKDLFAYSVKDLRRYGIRVDFEGKDIGNIEATTNISNNEIRHEFEVNAEEGKQLENWQIKNTFVSNKERLTEKLKIWLEGIYDIDSNGEIKMDDLGWYKTMESNKLFNYLEREISGSTTTQQMMEKVEALIPFKPYMKQVFEDLNIDHELKTDLFIAIGQKNHTAFVTVAHQDDGTFNIIESNRSNIQSLIVDDWKISFDGSNNKLLNKDDSINTELTEKYLHVLDNIVKIIKTKKEVDSEILRRVGLLLNQSGFYINKEALKAINTPTQLKNKVFEGYENILNLISGEHSLKSVLQSMSKGKHPFSSESDQSTSLKRMANIVKRSYDANFQSSFTNSEGEVVYSHIASRFVQKLINNLKNGRVNQDIIKWYQDTKFYKNSPWLNRLKSKDAQDKLDFIIFDGYKKDGQGTVYNKMSPEMLDSTVFNMFYNNGSNNTAYYALPILADNGNLAFIKFDKYSIDSVPEKLYQAVLQEYHRTKHKSHKREGFIMFPFMNTFKGDILEQKDDVINHIKGSLDKVVESELSYYKDRGMLTEKGDVIVIGDAFDSRIKDIKKELKSFIYNDFLAQSQIISLTSGDPAYYKHTGDYYKRVKEIWSPGTYIDTSAVYKDETGKEHKVRENYQGIYLKDVTKVSSHLDQIKKSINSLDINEDTKKAVIKQWESPVEKTDAQSYIDIIRYKEIMIGANRWTHKHEKALPNLLNGTATDKELNLILQPNKPFVFGHIKDKDIIVPIQHKNSEFLLLPQLAKGNPVLESFLEGMGYSFDADVSYNIESRKYDSINYESAVKVGLYNLHTVEDIQKGNIKYIHEFKNADYRLQQETPEHHLDSDNVFGTQIRKLILGDIDPNEIFVVDGKELTGREIAEIFQKLVIKDIDEKFDETNTRFDSFEDIVKLLREEIIDRDLGDEYLRATDIINGKTRLPLWHPIHANRNESILNSVWRNNVTRLKMKHGASFVNASSFGLSEEPKIIFNGDGTIKHLEALVPPYFKNFDKLYDNNITKIPDELKELVVYRIPTEDKYSMFKVKVVGFLPQESGGAIMLPDEVTKIAGLDFDIDKVYGFLPAYKVIGKEMHKIKPGFSSQEARDNYKLDIIKAVLSSKSALEPFLNGGSFDNLKDIRNEFFGKGEDLPLIGSHTRRTVFGRNIPGLALVGTFVNENNNQVQTQYSNIRFNAPILFDGKERSALNNRINEDGNRITKVLASFLAAVVDNAKDPVAGDLNINDYTANVLSMLVRVGYSEKTALAFINQPVVRKLTELYYKNGGDFQAENKAILELNNNEQVEETIHNFNTEDLIKNIGKDNINKQVLETFLAYRKMGGDLSNFSLASRSDSRGTGASLANNESFIRKVNKVKFKELKGGSLEGVTEFFSNNSNFPMNNAFFEKGIVEPNKIIQEKVNFPWNNKMFVKIKDMFEQLLPERGMTEKEIQKINYSLMTFITSGYDFYNHSEAYNLVYNKDSTDFLPNRLEAYKNAGESKYESLINQFSVRKDDKTGRKTVEFINNSGVDSLQQQVIRNTWRDMLYNSNATEQEKRLAEDLIKYSFYRTGFVFQRGSYFHMIPVDFMEKLGRGTNESFNIFLERSLQESKTNNLNKGNEYYKNFFSQYIRNNFTSLKAFVPSAVMDESIKNIDHIKRDKNKKPEQIVIGKQFADQFQYTLNAFYPYIQFKDNDKKNYLFKHTEKGVYERIPTLGIPNVSLEYNRNEYFPESHVDKSETVDTEEIKKSIEEVLEEPQNIDNIINQKIEEGTIKKNCE
jgi:hypothetical protein